MAKVGFNISLLVHAWDLRLSGILTLAGHEARSRLLVAALEDGGPVGDQGVELILRALRGPGQLSFAPRLVVGRGDHARMGALLLSEARRAARASGARLEPDAVLQWSEPDSFAWGLPLSDALRQVMGRIDGQQPVLALLRGLGPRAEALAAELAALVVLGAVQQSSTASDGEGAPPPLEHALHGADPLAHRSSTLHADPELSPVRGPAEEQRELVSSARKYIARRRWECADQLLSAARDLRLENPSVLALLALARARNPLRDPAARLEQALQLLSMAEQLDPRNPDLLDVVAELRLTSGLQRPSSQRS